VLAGQPDDCKCSDPNKGIESASLTCERCWIYIVVADPNKGIESSSVLPVKVLEDGLLIPTRELRVAPPPRQKAIQSRFLIPTRELRVDKHTTLRRNFDKHLIPTRELRGGLAVFPSSKQTLSL